MILLAFRLRPASFARSIRPVRQHELAGKPVRSLHIRRDLQPIESTDTGTPPPTPKSLRLPFVQLFMGRKETSRSQQPAAPRYGGRGALKRDRWRMTRNPKILLALARQGYSHRTIAEIAGVTPDALATLIGSSPCGPTCQRRKYDPRFDHRVRFDAYPIP